MGLSPRIKQTMFFFEHLIDKAFKMYNDRGCFVWSDKAEKIKDIYVNRNDWIVEYHRIEIDKFFKL